MRYVVQLLIPALVVIVVALVLVRNRGNPPSPTTAAAAPADTGGISTGTFVLILVIGAIFTVALIYALHGAGS